MELHCEICRFKDNDEVLYGEMMVVRQLRVHYYCLLLSTNLPQRGSDSSGILGFLLRDIRAEAAAARKRKCYYCMKMGASIQCHRCSAIFHLKCGIENQCTFEFIHKFWSYCDSCTPMDDYKLQLVSNPPKNRICDICLRSICQFKLYNIAYGDCCRRGFAHKSCMRRYALSSGYYLLCIWCRSKDFRNLIRLQSIFVPDRDAMWEKQRNAYRELYERIVRCDHDQCLCPNGRTYNKNSWLILSCKLCASTGVHFKCLIGNMRLQKGTESTEFKCTDCLDVELRVAKSPTRNMDESINGSEGHLNASFYIQKVGPDVPSLPETQAPVFSDDDDDYETSSACSIITVIPSTNSSSKTPPQNIDKLPTEPLIEIPVSPLREPLNEISNSPNLNSVEEFSDFPQSKSILTEDPSSLLVLKEYFRCFDEPYFYLVIYDFEHGKCMGKCTGSTVLRFNEDDPRIQDKSPESLQRLNLKPDDVWCRDKDRDVFEKIESFHQWLKLINN
ncbi:G2/M phase-specific E3 ubiquitin-protein ligase [Drosophila eugracilis]|uniref:G2/M phase-specific E3 ubiquitin-protein ligase n=1 Tax=Drosophila eugracilis TaxID=29029 RepID=UPI001BDB5F64|nr:G2/M phase-specific E3 ubiquitin-protein ligase [Drosophila eugracilis]